MAHMALLDATSTVIAVHVASDAYDGREFQLCTATNKTYRQTYPDGSKRKNYAVIGSRFDADRDAFILQKPYASWTLNETTCQWEAPSAKPDDGKMYNWNESSKSWVEYTTPPEST